MEKPAWRTATTLWGVEIVTGRHDYERGCVERAVMVSRDEGGRFQKSGDPGDLKWGLGCWETNEQEPDNV